MSVRPVLKAGFTLIEMIVTLAIFGLISGIVLANYGGFNTKILLTNLAYDVALTVRQAQVFGISVREFGGTYITRPYGVYFAANSAVDGTATSFVLFSDTLPAGLGNNNLAYDGTTACTVSDSECVERYAMQRGNYISSFCITVGVSDICSVPTGNSTTLKKMTILFIRPNPDAIITGIEEGPTSGSGDDIFIAASSISQAKITVKSPQNDSRTITVGNTGQISVN